mmetsp:Transcript_45249/g.112481  ORF Transcript_45249/g.112481 Transcript_45249/m.112481 type:complete len:235 (-) Transcript_45249:613-1317(-)
MAPIGAEASKSVLRLVTSLQKASTLFELTTAERTEAVVTSEEALEKAAEGVLTTASVLAVARVRPTLEPKLLCLGLEWDDFLALVERLRDVDTLQAELPRALVDTEGFLKEILLEVGGPLAVKLAARMLKAKVKPLAEPHGHWSLLEPAIDSIDSLEELLRFAEDPERFVREALLGAAIAALKHAVQPLAERAGLPWPVVEAVVNEIDELKELQAAIADPEGFTLRVARGAWHG